ncbi:hypothetical protein TruAng_007206 [Truncatella angustata]|nr:hypothetical protein TruAng_007206 [Truncatella angustata]
MKFGRDYQRLQLPVWKEAYIDYDNLKHIAKQQSNCLGYFESRLEFEIKQVNCFLQQQLNFLYGWIEATLSRFSLTALSLELKDLAQVAPAELHDLCDCLEDVLEFASQLEVFAKLNKDAIQKLFIKRSRVTEAVVEGSLEHGGLLFASPWLNTAARLRNLHDLASRAQSLHQDDPRTHSLLLQRVSPIALGCTSDEVHRSIGVDNSAELMVVLASSVSYLENQAMLYSVLQVAITCRASMCTRSLLEEITAPLEDVSCGHLDALHRLIIKSYRFQPELAVIDDAVGIFRELSPYQHHMLLVKDWRQRYPLHYAAEHGPVNLCKHILKFMEPTAVLEQDASGLTPLHLAVSGGHLGVVRLFLAVNAVRCMIAGETTRRLLLMAIQARSVAITECLLSLNQGLDLRDKFGRTPLYYAADQGQVEMVQALLTVPDGLFLNHVETSYGWSPLIVASSRGHYEIVKLLLEAGADPMTKDHRGWSALENASYRAHMTIVDALQHALPVREPENHLEKVLVQSRDIKPIQIQRPTYFSKESSAHIEDASFTSVVFSLGSFDINSNGLILNIATSVLGRVATSISSQMILEVAGIHCHEQPYEFMLPLLGDVSEITCVFSTTEPDNLQLSFKLIETFNDAMPCKRLLATGIALLGSIKGWFRPERQSLKRDSTVVLNTPKGDFAGTITFTHLVCKPYEAPGLPKPVQKMRLLETTQVVGHRGLGWNMTGLGRMQIGEHTVQSLQSALDQGADLIEFDVQITRDRVPVIYHDWQVSETGLDIPIHAMTYKQWMAISESQTNDHHDTPRGRLPWDERARPSAPPRRDSKSLCAHPDHSRRAMTERMKHTVEYARNHNKGNIRGDCIHDAFTTLRELFKKFPEDVNFDIELKYPMLWECPYWEMEPYWTEMNEYIDTTLDTVFELAGNRSIFFTCFNPEVCILLSMKQKAYPVVFLNDSMVSGPAGDQRAVSLQQAMRFARQWGLQGIVMAAEPFVAAPKLIKHVRDQGLVCGSYGSLNDIPEFATIMAQKQAVEGIDMLIVNNVRLISNTLRSLES